MYDLNQSIIQEYVLKLHSKNISVKTIKDSVSVIKNFLNKAYQDNLIKEIKINISYPKDNRKRMYVLNKEEQNKIMKYILNNINNKNIGILLAMVSGIRIGELCSLKWKDIDFNNKLLIVDSTLQRVYIKSESKVESKIITTSTKTYSSNRIIPISKEIINILKKYRNDNNYYILSGTDKCIEPRSIRTYYTNLLNKLNINHYTFHSLRHTFATNCISLGVDYKTLSELLGHSNINITLNLYVHSKLENKIKSIDKVYEYMTI